MNDICEKKETNLPFFCPLQIVKLKCYEKKGQLWEWWRRVRGEGKEEEKGSRGRAFKPNGLIEENNGEVNE